MELIELFAGIGGFAKGLEDAGFKIKNHYFSEIDKHSIANYKYNFPHAKHIGSVTDISGRDFKGIDIITFGSPCQDFSIAGNGEGLGGKRSVLILEAIRLVTEIRPPVFIWENVKGAFSSNSGADFWAIIQAFANIGGYRLEWQLLNTKWVLPQNRERIYLIGHLDGRSKPGVFPFSEDNFGFNERSIETTNIRTLTAGGHSGGLHSSMTLIKVNSATSSGFEIATEGDSINFSNPKSKTRRGRVGKNIAQTLDCGCNQAVMIGAIRGRNPENPKSRESGLSTEQMLEINENGCSNTLTSVQKDNVVVTKNYLQWDTNGKGQKSQQDRAFYENGSMGTIPSSRTENKVNVLLNDSSIRRLTEIECERIQGFPDDWTKYGVYEKQVWINKKEGTFEIVEGVKEIPKTQRYKQLGNAVTSKIITQIGIRLKKLLK
ncbi:DNA (cytosine-5-)-methyltransferase [Elizabethkingia anophelis]|nr:DNA (cytosine-5-)-methyltransferase [Elizabethkingia anophelis]